MKINPQTLASKLRVCREKRVELMIKKNILEAYWHLSRRHVVGSINTYIHSDGRGVQELMIKQLILGMV